MSHANPGRLFKNTIFLYFRMILVLGVSLYTSRVVINALGIEDFGIYNVVAGTVTLIAFLNSAMAIGTQRFLSYELGRDQPTESRRIFSTAMLIHLGVAILIFIIAETLGVWIVNHVLTIPEARLDAANWILQCAIFGLMVNIVQVPYTAVIISRERMNVYAYMSFVDVAAKLGIVFMLGIGGFDKLKLYGTLHAASGILVALLYALYCRKSFRECRLTTEISWPKMREMTSFVGWNLSAHIASVLSNQGVNMLLNVHFGPAINAARGVAMQASGTIQGFVGNIQAASAPQIVKTYAAGEIEQEKKLILFTCKITFCLLFLMALPVFLEARTVLVLWLKNPPPEAAGFLKLILIDALICTSANPMFHAIMATGRIKTYQIICSSVVMGSVLIAWFLLAKGFSAHVVFYIAILVSIFLLWRRLVFLKQEIGFSFTVYRKALLMPALKIITVSAVIPVWIHFSMTESLSRFIWVTLAAFTITPLAILWLGLQKNEVAFLKAKISAKFSKPPKAA
jgi:O-antigen/teichoic acid export membrane protein